MLFVEMAQKKEQKNAMTEIQLMETDAHLHARKGSHATDVASITITAMHIIIHQSRTAAILLELRHIQLIAVAFPALRPRV